MPATLRADSLAGRIRAEIVAGMHEPGGLLVETRIAEERSASRASVRDALQRLARIGLIEHASYQAARIIEGRDDDLVELLHVRSWIEPRLVGRFVERADAQQMNAFVAAQRTVDDALEQGDPVAIDEASQEFYRVLTSGARSWVLAAAVERETAQLRLVRAQLLGWTFELDRLRGWTPSRRIIEPWMRRRDARAAYRICQRDMVEDAARTLRELRRRRAA